MNVGFSVALFIIFMYPAFDFISVGLIDHLKVLLQWECEVLNSTSDLRFMGLGKRDEKLPLFS